MNLILCGLPRSGKSSIAKVVAKRLKLQWIDTDALIEMLHGPVSDLYLKKGESAFRHIEEQVIQSLEGAEGAVISVGGGAFTSAKNRAFLKGLGPVIYLNTSLDLIQQRLDSEEAKPAFLSKMTLQELAQKRSPDYEIAADLTISGTLEDEEWVETLLEQCLGLLHGANRMAPPSEL
jgi:shikimate kinase